MAASLSRPDPTSPSSVAEAGFTMARRGFHPDEVRAFLASVAGEMRRLQERERQLDAELRSAHAAGPGPAELDEDTVAALLGEETVRVLQTARESASQIRVRAEESAARVLRDAHDEANRLRQDAEIDAARRRQDAQNEAEAEVALAKQQGREMVNEARAYRERVLADLDRRTKLARQHIEELAHGRERLLQVFERARLVAVDITSDLHALVSPDEDVNLTPTTGPVPIMVKGSPRPTEPAPRAEPVQDVTVDVRADVTVEEPVDPTAALPIELRDDAGTDASDDDQAEIGAGAEIADEVVDDAVDVVEVVDDAGEEADVVAEMVIEEPVAPAPRDTNVVALFPGRPAAAEPAGEPAPEPNRHPVDDIFARLRSSSRDDAMAAAEHELDDDEPADELVAPAVSTPFTRRDEALVPVIVTAARKLKRVLADEQNLVLDTLRRREPVQSLDAILPSLDEHVARYADAITDELAASAAAGAAELGAHDTPTLRRTLAKAGALDAARSVVRTDLVTPLRDRLERSVIDGGDNDDITRRVRSVYREWKTQHIDDQLDDVFRFAFGGGVAVTVEPGTPMRWTIDPSEPACADCEDNSLAGPVAAGEAYPTGHTMAPAHPGCRCLTVPARQ